MLNTVALIISVLLFIGLLYYHLKYKKPFIEYEANIYEKMVSITFYIMLIAVIIFLIALEFKK
jgi:hypothetical protein